MAARMALSSTMTMLRLWSIWLAGNRVQRSLGPACGLDKRGRSFAAEPFPPALVMQESFQDDNRKPVQRRR
jgi:hypothetical protein